MTNSNDQNSTAATKRILEERLEYLLSLTNQNHWNKLEIEAIRTDLANVATKPMTLLELENVCAALDAKTNLLKQQLRELEAEHIYISSFHQLKAMESSWKAAGREGSNEYAEQLCHYVDNVKKHLINLHVIRGEYSKAQAVAGSIHPATMFLISLSK